MGDETTKKVHWSFWVIGVVAVIWNAMGVLNFALQMNADGLTGMPEWWLAVIESRPAWATGAMAISVVCGLLGGVMLLVRKSSAYYLFLVSLLATLATIAHAASVEGAGARQIFEGLVMPVVVALFLVWYAKMAERKGWTG